MPTRLALLLVLLVCGACRDFEIDGTAPEAYAGADQIFDGGPVDVVLDGSSSQDVDGEILSYEWFYTGDPRGDEGLDDDAGLEAVPVYARPLPDFCPPFERPEDNSVFVPQRWCPVGETARTEVSLEDGVHRFTLYVTDDDGFVDADSVVVYVGVEPPDEAP